VTSVRPIATDETGADRVIAALDPAGTTRPTGVPLLRIEAREDIVVARAAASTVG
jgi:hypothetical protein